ncbi:hypothetical protein FGW37_05260 [Streptomyces rectiverticillatus]|uniref:hypothetical protein n=1 Tax=Streptomyces rectiverticillatus TaxID=173860 RepID=UPI0015C400B9|nr:hypothetical protein [Streptomyces rectiverticillatus]QLE71089.1 hypothetical protein FGW37_05260 [Streptomyces rectiverticillatus]
MIDWDLATEAAKVAAARLHRIHRAYTEPDDIEQEILLRLASEKPDLTNYGRSGLINIFIRMGNRYCKAERRRYAYHAAEFLYSTDDVRKILTHAYYTEQARNAMPAREDAHHDDIDNKSIAVAIWDIDEAMGSLSDGQRSVIEKTYLLGHDLTSAERVKLSRAVQALADTLNKANITGAAKVEVVA